MKSPTRTGPGVADRAPASGRPDAWPHRIRRRLNESRLRSRLRGLPRLQGRILAPAGTFRRLPAAPGLHFPFYHDVPAAYAGDLRRHLAAFRRRGPMVSWTEALDLLSGERPLDRPMFCLSFDDGHPTWRDVVVPILRELDVPAMFFLTSGLIGRPGNLSWRDCRDMAAAGFSFGSHSVSHPRLADVDDATAEREIRGSKEEIEDGLGLEVRDFAAPYGQPGVDFGDRDVRLAAEAGYRSFANTVRAAMHAGDSPLWIQRQGLHPAWPLWAVRTRVHD
jgi:peptidoglycan/xylan/chitin deacetylase (PgdA/CDA1 family)